MNIQNAFLSQLSQHWQGPTVDIIQDQDVTKLGEGDAKAKIIIHDKAVLRRMLRNPSLAFGEGYMNGDIVIEGQLLDILQGYYQTIFRLPKPPMKSQLQKLHDKLSDRIGLEAASQNASSHYNLGNDFYKLWLDPALVYTCAYYANQDDDLATAQRQKLELICRKARLAQGQEIIDLGCGWGGLLFHAIENYNVTATGVVVAKEQGNYIVSEAKRRGLADKINVVIGDWREATGKYDRVFSVGVAEHIGAAQYEQFLDLYYDLLHDGGIAFLHTIGRHPQSSGKDPWLRKYIFPGGSLPRLEQLLTASQNSGFTVVDIEDLWQHYAKTLNHWAEGFEEHLDQIKDMYDEKFTRMWRLYLRSTQAGFQWGTLELWQMVMVKDKTAPWPLNREVHTNNLT